MTVIPERLDLLDKLILDTGAHQPAELVAEWNKTACLLETASYLAGEPWSDHPQCVSPVLTSFGIRLNDLLPEDKRQTLKQFIPDLIGTRDDGHDDARRDLARQWLMADWLPQWLRLARLDDLAVKAERSAHLTGKDLREAIYAIRDLAYSERVARRNALKAEVEMRLREKWAAEGRPAAAAAADVAAAADAAEVAVEAVAAVAVAVAAAVAVAVAAADAAAVAVAVADAVADVAAAADAAADAAVAADVAAAADAAADAAVAAAAAGKAGYVDLYWPIRRALDKHYAQSDTFAAVRALRDRQLDAAVDLFGQMVRVGKAS